MKKLLMNCSKIASILLIALISIQLSAQKTALTEQDKTKLIERIKIINEKDQRHRRYIALGTLDDSLAQDIKAKSEEMDIRDYLVYTSKLNLQLPKSVEDSLWKLQHQLDEENYYDFVRIVKEYGYPSKERLGTDEVSLIVVLLHPPVQLDIPEYLETMTNLLLPEVKAGHLRPKLFALFYDNIKAKILNEPQLYGTNTPFDFKTKSLGLPPIANIEKTNNARKAIGLPPLGDGEYVIAEK